MDRYELIASIKDCSLADYIIEHYEDMPTKTVKRLLILLAQYFTSQCDKCREDLIYDIVEFYKEDFR